MRRLRIESVMEKSSTSRGQRIAYITAKDFDRVKEYLVGTVSNSDVSIIIQSEIGGVFYLIQLEPEHDPGRIKLGFATDVNERLRKHKTSAPFAIVLKTWPCKLLWEKTAIESVSQDCDHLREEVFRAASIDEVISRCDQFFTLMPKLT